MKDDKAGIVELGVAYSLSIIEAYHELEKDGVRSHQSKPKEALNYSLLTLYYHE